MKGGKHEGESERDPGNVGRRCTADGSWRPIRSATPGVPGSSAAQDEAQRRSAERERRLQEALASSSLAIDFTDATLHDPPRDLAQAADGERSPLADAG